MNRVTFVCLTVLTATLILRQTYGQVDPTPVRAGPERAAYQPAVAAPSTTVVGGGGYGWGGGGQTPQGAALQGLSQVISAQGQYNLNTSAAAINLTEAERNQMQNDVQGVDTFWAMRESGAAARARERLRINGPMPTPEEFARRARAGAPKPLTARDMDPVSGRLNWPDALQDSSFSDQRDSVAPICAKWATYGALDFPEQKQLRDTLNGMYTDLKGQIAQIPPQSYVAAKGFLQSLLFATTNTTL